MKTAAFAISILFVAVSAFAHVTVAPQQSGQGATQIYKVRVHNEEKIATTSIELDIPEGVTVTSVAPVAGGKSSSAKSGDRIVKITWDTEVPPAKYVELAFTAKNPATATSIQWNVHQHMADGKVIEWSDKAGAHGKPSLTKIVATTPAPAAK